MRCYRGISQVRLYWNAIACHLVLQFEHLLRYCIVLDCICSTGYRTTYDIAMAYHRVSFIGMLLHIIWYCNLNVHLHILYMCVCFHCLKASRFLYCVADHVMLLRTVGENLIGHHCLPHGIAISKFVEVLYCIIFLLHGIISQIAYCKILL